MIQHYTLKINYFAAKRTRNTCKVMEYLSNKKIPAKQGSLNVPFMFGLNFSLLFCPSWICRSIRNNRNVRSSHNRNRICVRSGS